MWERIPADFNAISFAIDTVPTLDENERQELEASPWARVPDQGGQIADDWRQQAGAALVAIGDTSAADPARAAVLSQLLTAQATMVEDLVELTRSPRFDRELPEDLRPAARALCARSYFRALMLEVDPEGVLGPDDDAGNVGTAA